ncbi:hypothetical protein QFC20_002086 [Naganishia adeliensis]|uniref:Uncharacterized protein n=1 Tax=Naganishia adeliensis TaxID=92952 RepID=A0ACC2WMS9_9TREE|nr:hypothetical protein QFC20_002086 [Naganishia adeliensis]
MRFSIITSLSLFALSFSAFAAPIPEANPLAQLDILGGGILSGGVLSGNSASADGNTISDNGSGNSAGNDNGNGNSAGNANSAGNENTATAACNGILGGAGNALGLCGQTSDTTAASPETNR